MTHKAIKRIRIATAIVLGVILIGTMILNQSKFGQSPKGERLEKIKLSKNYTDGEFKNIHETNVMTSDKGGFSMMMDFLFKEKIRRTPEDQIPTIKTDIRSIDPNEDILIWFGHSSYYIQVDGKSFLIDPVFSTYGAPFSFVNKAFKGTSLYQADDFDRIDFLIITHDHWDHLDYQTVMDLKPKLKKIICPLGVGQHFEYWDFDPNMITELDWYEEFLPSEGWKITATPSRHFSGRGLKRNQTLWASFALQTPNARIFIGGDGGFDTFYSEIGNIYGPFDLAILEQGQYDQNWSLIHLLPEKVFDVADQLQAKKILPVHHSRFALANHPWDEPLNKIANENTDKKIPVLTPKIGELIHLKDGDQQFEHWWKEIN